MQGFISYSHQDYDEFKRFKGHLTSVERAFGVSFWSDERLNAGDYWSEQISQKILEANIHILLLSPGFIGSDYIWNHELPAIQQKAQDGDLVACVVIKRCQYEMITGPLQAIPSCEKGRLKPVNDWHPKENGFDAVRKQLNDSFSAHLNTAPNALNWGV